MKIIDELRLEMNGILDELWVVCEYFGIVIEVFIHRAKSILRIGHAQFSIENTLA